MSEEPSVIATGFNNVSGGGIPVAGDIASLVNRVIKAGPGGTVTQDMVDQANKVKPVVDKANG
ncbi:hypothetical protein [Streptomyces sp. NPDC048361]|uniref:hypothetical protein n=1 Tax=Streptomyces sp. NPDC048361 TaxID=3154720 RepID=UPI00342D1956